VVKLHLFSGYVNRALGISKEMELGHLYDDGNDFRCLMDAGKGLGMDRGWIQKKSGFYHFDVWGVALEKAKQLFPIVSDTELATDMASIAALLEVKG